MKIILLEKIKKLGSVGDTATVKDGYARNFLIPYKKALRFTEESYKIFAQRRTEIEASDLRSKNEAAAVAPRLENKEFVFVRKASEKNHLYGSIKTSDIVKALEIEGFIVKAHQIKLEHSIKELGTYKAEIALHSEVKVNILLNVVRGTEEHQTS